VEIDSNNLPVFHSPSRLRGRSELESSSKNSRKIIASFVLALTNMGLGDQAAAFKLIERAMAVIPIKTDAVEGPFRPKSSPIGGSGRRARPCYRRFTETTLDTVLYRPGFRPAVHSCAVPTRSVSRRSRIPKTLRGKAALIPPAFIWSTTGYELGDFLPQGLVADSPKPRCPKRP
jgi:hypothetical protein